MTESRRILITGLSTYWGGRLAQLLEQDPAVEAIIGVDRRPPKVELHRTEYVHVADSHSLIRRIVHAAEIDTVVDTRLVLDPIVTSARRAHENNVLGTMNVLAACGGDDTPVRKLVFRSGGDYYGAEQDDPAFFTEAMRRPHPPRTPLERDIVEAEQAVAEFAAKHEQVQTIVLRYANALGRDVRTSLAVLLDLPVVPAILGFEPRLQFIHEDDVVGVLDHAVRGDVPGGIYNAAADGVLVLSEIAGLLGKPLAPVIPPWGTGLATTLLRRAGLPLHPLVLGQLRFGRALDNRRIKATGYRYTYTSREAVIKLAEYQRLRRVLAVPTDSYRYEQEVEEFLRRSPSVRATARAPEDAPANLAPGERRGANGSAPPTGYDELTAEEVVRLLPALDADGRKAIADYERAHARRKTVLRAVERLQSPETPA
ncbi:MAG: NAD-dependent epimerase/dehydratase family protein [Solirubrobacteraceae bacterium]